MTIPTPSSANVTPTSAEHTPYCPITGRKYWGHVIHPEFGAVATYGGPFDTYMIPVRTGEIGADDEWTVYRYDQDRGEWLTEGFL